MYQLSMGFSHSLVGVRGKAVPRHGCDRYLVQASSGKDRFSTFFLAVSWGGGDAGWLSSGCEHRNLAEGNQFQSPLLD